MGVHFLTGFEPPLPGTVSGTDINKKIAESRRHFQAVEDQLRISVDIIDVSREFKETVVDYFIHTYRSGQTPNPCLICNPAIKFTTLLNTVKQMGADKLATGHYVQKKTERRRKMPFVSGN